MNPTLHSRIAALSAFVLLMSGFVAYRAGALDKFLHRASISQLVADENNAVAEAALLDTPITSRVDTPRGYPTMMSTSKSTIIMDESMLKILSPDSIKKTEVTLDSSSDDETQKEKMIMGGSKSGYISPPRTFQTPTPTQSSKKRKK